MIGTFRLNKGEVIQILVGQEGGINTDRRSSGGGGGTFVVRGADTPLIIAGGGGGIGTAGSRHDGCDASTNATGNSGYKLWSGGSNGLGAQTADDGFSGGGGGGFYSSGRSGKNFNGTKGKAVERVVRIPVGAVVDPTMLETISRMNAVSARLVMVK